MLPARIGDPAIAIAQRAARRMREGAADDDRRVWLLHRFGPRRHRAECDEIAVVFGGLLGPDLLHRLDPLAHQLEAGFELGAVVLHFVLVPAAADPE